MAGPWSARKLLTCHGLVKLAAVRSSLCETELWWRVTPTCLWLGALEAAESCLDVRKQLQLNRAKDCTKTPLPKGLRGVLPLSLRFSRMMFVVLSAFSVFSIKWIHLLNVRFNGFLCACLPSFCSATVPFFLHAFTPPPGGPPTMLALQRPDGCALFEF